MAQTYVEGVFNRDDMVGIPESVARGLAELENSATPFLTAVSPNLNNLSEPARDTTHYFFEKQWRPMRTTLNGAISSGDTTIVFADKAFKQYELVAIDEEVVKLGATADSLTFTGCTRSLDAGSAAAHVTASSCLGLGRSWVQGSAAGTADMIVQPDKVTQYSQIFKREVGVSNTAKGLEQYHRQGSLYDNNVQEQMRNMRQELENSVLRGVAQAAVADTTEGRLDGFYERMIASSCTTTLSGAAPTRENIRAAIRAIKDYSGEGAVPDFLFCSDYVKDVIDDWQLPYIRHQAGSMEAQRFGANVKAVELGGLLLNLVPMSKLKTHMALVTSQFIRVGPLAGGEPVHTYHGVDGDRIKGFLRMEMTAQIMAPKSCHMFYNVASSG